MPVLATLLAVALGAAFLVVDPAATFSSSAAARLGFGALAAGATLFAQVGAGLGLSPRIGWLRALAWGMGAHVVGVAGLWGLGVTEPWAFEVLLLLLASGWLRAGELGLPRVTALAALVGAVLLFPALVEALAPPTDTDELYYQLAIPRFLLDHGALPGGFLHPDQSRPLPVQLLHASTLALGGEPGPRLWELGVAIALVLGVRQQAVAHFGPGRGDVSALALLGSWSFVQVAGLAYAELALALWLLVAAEATLGRRWAELGIMAGLALSAKYTAAPLVAGLFLVAAWDGRRELPKVGVAVLLSLLAVAPWWLRNAGAGLHPLFPFAGWPDAKDFVFVYPEKYGAGRSLVDFLLLPWRVFFTAEPDSFRFLGRVSLVWVALGAGAALAWRSPVSRRLGLVLILGLVTWAASAQLLRYLLPLAGVAALAGGALRSRWPAWILLVASLPANLAPAWQRAAAELPVVVGHEARDVYLERELPAWPALRYLRDEVPADEPVALLNAWFGYLLEQPYVLGSVEDHVPTRHWVWAHGEDALGELWRGGVRWLLVGEIKYLRKTYTFLPEGVYQSQLRDPQSDLERLLLRDAHRVYAANRYAVWRLDEPSPGP